MAIYRGYPFHPHPSIGLRSPVLQDQPTPGPQGAQVMSLRSQAALGIMDCCNLEVEQAHQVRQGYETI